MKSYNWEAIVLKNKNYKDADKMVTFLSKENGKFMAIARGVRKISSRRAGNLDSLNHVIVKITESDIGYKNIQEVKTKDSFKNIKSNYENLKQAQYITELIDKSLVDEDKNDKIFDLLYKILKLLDRKYTDSEVLVLYFEISLLKFLGYQLPKIKGFPLLSKLNSGKFSTNSVEELKKMDSIVKTYIYEYVADKLKSLELK